MRPCEGNRSDVPPINFSTAPAQDLQWEVPRRDANNAQSYELLVRQAKAERAVAVAKWLRGAVASLQSTLRARSTNVSTIEGNPSAPLLARPAWRAK
jgi:hypothetical protein